MPRTVRHVQGLQGETGRGESVAAGAERAGDREPGEVRSDHEAVQDGEKEAAEEMKCKECAEGRRFSEGGVYCVHYGIIIREEHECTREGGRLREGDDDQRGTVQDETEAQGDSCGAA